MAEQVEAKYRLADPRSTRYRAVTVIFGASWFYFGLAFIVDVWQEMFVASPNNEGIRSQKVLSASQCNRVPFNPTKQPFEKTNVCETFGFISQRGSLDLCHPVVVVHQKSLGCRARWLWCVMLLCLFVSSSLAEVAASLFAIKDQ